MRRLEIIAGIILALIVFAGLELVGMILKFALIAAVLGFVAGILLARGFRSGAR